MSEVIEPVLLAPGKASPDFSVVGRDGELLRLSDFRGRIVLLEFWATWCAPCQASLDHTLKVAPRYVGKGLAVFAVAVWDRKPAFENWLADHPAYSCFSFAIDPKPRGEDVAQTLYQVSYLPTQYIVDRGGSIVWGLAGFGEPIKGLLEEAIDTAFRTESETAPSPKGQHACEHDPPDGTQ